MKAGRNALIEIGIPMPPTESADNFYLIFLTEVGPLGFFLFFLFFGRIVRFALLAAKKARAEPKPLLIGVVAGLASLATQTLADNPLAGHAIGTTLWLFAGVMLAGARYVQAEAQSSSADRHTAAVDLHRQPDYNLCAILSLARKLLATIVRLGLIPTARRKKRCVEHV